MPSSLWEENMAATFTRRGVVALGSAALAAPLLSRMAFAQDPVHIRFSACEDLTIPGLFF